MLNQATLDKLHALRLTGMAEAYQKQLDEPEARGLNFEERFGMLVDSHKTWLGQALAQKACLDGDSVLYRSAAKLFRDLAQARADGSLRRLLESIARTEVLLVDDFAMAPLSDGERRSFLEICDDRYGRRSTLLTSQLPVASWHAQIGDPT